MTTSDIQHKLKALWPTAPAESFVELAGMLTRLVEGTLSMEAFAQDLRDRDTLAAWRWFLAGKNVGNAQNIYAFDDAGNPLLIDAKYTQGFLNKPTGPVIQFFGGPILPPPEVPGPRVLLCFDVEDQQVRPLVDALRHGLAEYKPFLVRHPMRNERGWRDDLYLVTSVCDAAIVLLSEGALRSDTVARVTSLFTARSHAEYLSPPVLLPVLLNSVTQAQVSASRLASYDLARFGLLEASDAPEIMAALEQRLAPLKGILAKDQRPLNRIEQVGQSIAELFPEQLPTPTLNFLASKVLQLYVEQGSWPDARLQFAWGLWNTQPSCVRTLVQQLKSSIKKEAVESDLLSIISPGWIDPWAASRIPVAVKQDLGRRAIWVNATAAAIPRDYVRRAYCSLLEYGESITIGNASNGDFDTLTDEVRQGLARILKYRGSPTDDQLEQRMKKLTQEVPVFVIVHELPPAPIIRQLLQVRLFQYSMFFFFTERTLAPEEMAEYNDVVIFLEPPLDKGLEDEALLTYNYDPAGEE